MGMYMSYREADRAAIEQMISRCGEESLNENDFCDTSDFPEMKCETCYLDKMWDGLHCLLTGLSACTPMKDNLLSEAVVGGDAFSDEGVYFVSYISPERMPQILSALNAFDLEAALSAFSPDHFSQEKIYPNIWLRDDKEELKQGLRAAFEILRDFYDRIAKKNKGVIISLY